jgi:cation diffusion facilitator CzcD-associated flavoprotein CzcO
VHARTVVLATGIDGAGAWHVPEAIRRALPRALYAHTHEPIAFDALRGKRVAVLGAGASAFDNAACALEAGAAAVGLFFRRAELVRVNPYRWAEFVGFLKHHGDLADAERWRFARQILVMGQLPPADTFARATAHRAFRLHPGEPWTSVRAEGREVVIHTPRGVHRVDYVIVGAGFTTDLTLRPELAELAPHIALWRDRYTPPPGLEHDELSRHPYLGPGFELQEREPGSAPSLGSVFHFTFGCLPSLGFGGASISGMKYGLPRVIAGVTRRLYRDDAEHHFASLAAYDAPELPPTHAGEGVAP